MGAGLSSPSARAGRRRRRNRPMAEINVTPFVDVMLVLLIIFMVAAPLLTVGVPLKLPETDAQALPAEAEPPLTVNLATDGKIYLQETPMDFGEFTARLPAIAAERKDGQVYLRADAGLSYGAVAKVMGALNAAGFGSIALVTDAAPPSAER
ncbi:ExbD/TolR family protein [Pikeienuella sp. HZG-20]|uniref:ExbD/TolR family protein n=1 Tax=Paludibacillus litoralis TaxID=3133267 RepID=UPI0030EEE0DE